jgi:hypothetical protein
MTEDTRNEYQIKRDDLIAAQHEAMRGLMDDQLLAIKDAHKAMAGIVDGFRESFTNTGVAMAMAKVESAMYDLRNSFPFKKDSE